MSRYFRFAGDRDVPGGAFEHIALEAIHPALAHGPVRAGAVDDQPAVPGGLLPRATLPPQALENDELAEIYYERENEYTLAGSIYKGRVTRVLPGMQSAFVEVGLERDAFLYVTDFLEEQEDSEEFERTSLSGNQQRRDNGRNRQPQPEQQSAQEPSTAPARDRNPVKTNPPPGTRRWRGRRGRGRGMRAARTRSSGTR